MGTVNTKKKKGFTLVEIIVVIAVIGVIIPALFAIIFAILREQIKIYQLSEVKRQGDFALTLMEGAIRNSAYSIYDQGTGGNPLCDDAGDSDPAAYFRDTYDNWFRFYLSGTKLISDSAVVNASGDITNDRVTISGFSITCEKKASFTQPLVNIEFTVTAGNGATRQEERASMTYRTKVRLRAY